MPRSMQSAARMPGKNCMQQEAAGTAPISEEAATADGLADDGSKRVATARPRAGASASIGDRMRALEEEQVAAASRPGDDDGDERDGDAGPSA